MEGTNNSDSEELIEKECRLAFIEHLQRSPAQRIEWLRQHKYQTPDYRFVIDAHEIGVEVTSIWHNLEFNPSDMKSELGIGPLFDSFVKEVKKQAVSKGILNASYALSFDPPKNFKATKKEMLTAILDAIQQLQDEPIGSRCGAREFQRAGIRVRKIGLTPNELILGSHSSGKGGFTTDIDSQFWNAVQLAIEKKAKIRELMECNYPVAILLYDGYRLAPPDTFLAVPVDMPSWCPFGDVLLVHEGQVFHLMCSKRLEHLLPINPQSYSLLPDTGR